MKNEPLSHKQIKDLPLGFSVTGELPGRRARRERISAQNAVRQVTKPGYKPATNKDGHVTLVPAESKAIFHPKKFHAMQYQNYAEIWKQLNTAKRNKNL